MNFRPPSDQFAITEYRWEDKNGKIAKSCVGQAATLIGWIPAYQDPEHLPPGCLQEMWAEDESVPLLLSTGNPAPPENFSGPADLIRYLQLKEFRAALAIDSPTLDVDAEGRPVALEFSSFARVGSTPFRPGHFIKQLDWLTFYSGGVNESCGQIWADERSVVIRIFVRVKLGFLGQLVARIKTGDWPPWATMTVEYAFDLASLQTKVDFLGTSVPSQTRYIGWSTHSRYRIDHDMSWAGYEGFVKAGNCSDATAYRTQNRPPVKIFDGTSEY